MKLLLTSAGIRNTSIHNALVDLLGKPIAESSALCIPTRRAAVPRRTVTRYRFISGSAPSPMCELGWKSLGVLELTALPSVKKIGSLRFRRRRSAGLGRQSLVSVLLDAAVRAGRPLAVAAARDGLRRHERRSDGGDPRLRRSDLRRE